MSASNSNTNGPHGQGLESPEWLRVTLYSIGDAVMTADVEGRVTFLNPVAQVLTGWTPEQSSGVKLENVFQIVNEETRATVESPTVQALRDGVVVGLANHTLLIAKDGTERPIDDSAAPIRNETGEVAGVVLVFRDITERREQETRLADALAYAEAIVGTVRNSLVVLDGDLRVMSANRAFYRSFRVTPEATTGILLHELGNGQWAGTQLKAKLDEILLDDSSFEDYRIEHDFPLIGRRVMILNARQLHDGLPARLVLLAFEDVTEREEAQSALSDSESRYRRLFESAKDGIIILDAESGKIIDANAFLCNLLGHSLAELLDKELWEIGLFADTAENKRAFDDLRREGYLRYEHLPIQNKQGETIEVEFVSNVYYEDSTVVAQCNIRDIRDRSRLERQSRRKDEFLAMLSHELRNPLAPIRSALDLLRLQDSGQETPLARNAREVIERQVSSLTRLVGDLLEVSRVTTGRIRLMREVVDLGELVRRALETVDPAFREHDQSVQLELPEQPIHLSADPTRIEESLVNLLNNASKYTEPEGRILVRVTQQDNEAIVSIRDSGIGIPADLLPTVFDLFTQAERSLDRSQGGLGLGLHLVQRLVELHGGTVAVRSEGTGHGSEFIIRLPIVSQEQPKSVPAPVAAAESASLRVLVVDDNVDACDTLADLLRLSGHVVQTAYTGPDGLRAATIWQPDAALVDIGLPEISGYEVARRLRESAETSSMKIIALTGYGNAHDVQLAHAAGFDEHLTKPIAFEQIKNVLEQVSK